MYLWMLHQKCWEADSSELYCLSFFIIHMWCLLFGSCLNFRWVWIRAIGFWRWEPDSPSPVKCHGCDSLSMCEPQRCQSGRFDTWFVSNEMYRTNEFLVEVVAYYSNLPFFGGIWVYKFPNTPSCGGTNSFKFSSCNRFQVKEQICLRGDIFSP